MQPDPKTLQPASVDAVPDIEAPWQKQDQAQPSDLQQQQGNNNAISTEQQHIFGAHLRPRKQVFFDEATYGYIVKHSRPQRKNRFAEFVSHDKQLVVVPKWPQVLRLDYKNISWHVAMYFTLGSVAWIINGQYAMWPVQGNANLQVNVNLMGYSALVGGLLFWAGAYLAVVEALNENQTSNFGIELHHVLDALEKEPRDIQKFVKKEVHLRIQQAEKAASGIKEENGAQSRQGACHLIYFESKNKTIGRKDADDANAAAAAAVAAVDEEAISSSWRWWGTVVSSLGWWASIIQFTGATAFTISVITGTPGVLSASQWQLDTALSWTMQVVGSICFLVSSAMLMLEEQRDWYLPALDRIGWHSAFWNVIGSIGFLLCAVFGYLANWGGKGEICCQFWGTAFNTYYGSWAFLISSVLLLIEVEMKEPTHFDQLVSRGMAWVAVKTRCDSEDLEEKSRHQEEEVVAKVNGDQ